VEVFISLEKEFMRCASPFPFLSIINAHIPQKLRVDSEIQLKAMMKCHYLFLAAKETDKSEEHAHNSYIYI